MRFLDICSFLMNSIPKRRRAFTEILSLTIVAGIPFTSNRIVSRDRNDEFSNKKSSEDRETFVHVSSHLLLVLHVRVIIVL